MSAKEVLHVLRDPRTLYLGLGMPVLLLLLFGYGVSFDLAHLPIAFVDLDQSPSSRELRGRLVAHDEFDSAGSFETAEQAEATLLAGEAVAALVIPAGFERRLSRGERTTLQLLVDGSDNNTAVQATAKMEASVRALSLALPTGSATVRARPIGAPRGGIEARAWTRFNPEARSAIFLIPGITAYVLAIVAVLLTCLTVAREWERGSMAQLFSTPIGRLEIILGKLLPYLILGSLAVLLVLAVGAWVFSMPFRGSPWALVLIAALFLSGMLAQGLLISAITRNQLVATQAATMSSMLPTMLLSGFIFPIENMPEPLQWLTVIIPARYFVEGLRGILLRGNTLVELWPQAAALAIFTVVMVALSTTRFRRSIA